MSALKNYHDNSSVPETIDQGAFFEQQNLHHGRIAERAVRRSQMGIS